MMAFATAPSFPFARTMPILDTGDLAHAIAFYKEKLGFEAVTFGEPATFAILQRGMVTLGLALKEKPVIKPAPEWSTYIYVADADAVHAEWTAQGVAIIEAICDKFYNCRDFTISDSDGNSIGVGHVRASDPLGPGLSMRVGRDGKAAS